MKTALLFPGQGSQAVGMGQALSAAFQIAKDTFAEVDDALSFNLSKLMAEGPESDLTMTENAQPAIMACSIAALRVMQQEMGFDVARQVSVVAGHSLGEYSALTAVGSLALADTARLLQIRGRAMQQAVPAGQGGMAAILGLPIEEVEYVCGQAAGGSEVCEVANYNSDGQIVISGTMKAMEAAMGIAKEKGAKRAIALPVSAPFHSSLMEPAANAMREALANATIFDPCVPVVANVTAEPTQCAEMVRQLLVDQVTGMVRWKESIDTMNDLGVERYMEVGHGKVLTGMVKRMAPDAQMVNIGTPEDLDAFDQAA